MTNISLPKKLKDDFVLKVEQIVYVPSTIKADKKISKKEFNRRVSQVEKFLSRKFGGKTSTKVEGGYISEAGKLINEPVVKVCSYATEKDFNKHKDALYEQIKVWCKKWKQESIGYEIEGDLYYIKG